MAELFPDSNYRFQMNLERGSIREFFRETSAHEEILRNRRYWLAENPTRYAEMREPAVPLLDETLEILNQMEVLDSDDLRQCCSMHVPSDRCLELGRILEPDYLFLIPDGPQFRLVGACVCFPSSWSLQEKIDRPLDFIHDVVPDLNAQIGSQITRFLFSLKPGTAMLRANWGLSRSGEFNQHPSRKLPRLAAETNVDEIWLRIERQALVHLPQSSGVLFGIRIETFPVLELKAHPKEAHGLARALRTMPPEMARYKNIEAVRERVACELEKIPPTLEEGGQPPPPVGRH